jgi:Asp-tRNA(Asn)/Glu-tRNA(Gln) amidotransferase A subunit family amidase
MIIADIEAIPLRIPFKAGTKSDASAWGDSDLPAADSLLVKVTTDQGLVRGLPAMGLPGLTLSTNLIGSIPVGVQIVAGHFREDLCLLAGKAIEARGTPTAPIDPGG